MKKLIVFLCLVSFQAQAQEVYNFYFQKKADDASVNGAPAEGTAPQVVVMTPAKPEPFKRTNKYINLGLANWTISAPSWMENSSLGFNGVAATIGYHLSPKWAIEAQGIFGNSKDSGENLHQSLISGSAAYDAVSTPAFGRTVFDLYVLGGGSYIMNWYQSSAMHAALRAQLTLTDNFGLFLEYRKYLSVSDLFAKSANVNMQTVPDQLTTLSVALNF
jgi:hypothetical protein